MGRKGKKWTDEEVEYLENNYKKLDKEIASELDRTIKSINYKRQRLGLTKKRGMRPKKIEVPELNENKAYILGFLYGDGCLFNQKNNFYRVAFTSPKKELKVIQQKLKETYDVSTRIVKQTTKDCVFKGRKINDNGKTYDCIVDSKIVVQDLAQYGPTKSKKWRVPEEIWDSTDNIKASFISGLFDADGWVSFVHKNSVRVGIRQVNKEAIGCLSKLLDSLKIKSTQFHNGQGSLLVIGYQYFVEEFARKIDFKLPRKQNRLEKLLGERGFNYHNKLAKYKKLKKDFKKGELTHKEIAEKYDMSRRNIYNWLGRNKRKRSPPRFIKLYEGGYIG